MGGPAASGGASIPLVVHVGFAGSRHLLPQGPVEPHEARRFGTAVEAFLVERLTRLRTDLHLAPHHLLCGISQVAIGADLALTRALRTLHVPQRVFLPQPRDVYFAATGSTGAPDFAPAERAEAQGLLASPHVIQERVVSDAPVRDERFLEVNIEIARLSDVVVCLVRAGSESEAKKGGTHDLVSRALARGRPVLEVRVEHVPGAEPRFAETWHRREAFVLPSLPRDLDDVQLDPSSAQASAVDVRAYGGALKFFASAQAMWRRRLFTGAALVIVGTHLAATLLAVWAFLHHLHSAVGWILGVELLLLAAGFTVHELLHRSHAVRAWALSRLVAEIARSVGAMGGVPTHLSYLFDLPLPLALRPLVRTLHVLHLRDSRPARTQPWTARRDAYLAARIEGPKGQVEYYRRKGGSAARGVRRAQGMFLVCSGAAILATVTELVCACVGCEPPAAVAAGLAWLAIALPMLAVAALSITAALDLEARDHIYGEMGEFLRVQADHLKRAGSEGEFLRLALETESHLLGETANWFVRRSFLGVA